MTFMAGSKAPIILGAAAVGLFALAKGGFLGGGGGRGSAPRTTTFDITKEVDLTSLIGDSHVLSIPGDKLVIKSADPKVFAYEVNEIEGYEGWLKVTPVGLGGGEIVIERVVPEQIATEEMTSGPMAGLKVGDTVEPQLAAIDFRLLPSDTVYQAKVVLPRKA